MPSAEIEIASMADIDLLPLDQRLLPDSLAVCFEIPQAETSDAPATAPQGGPPRTLAAAGSGSAFSAPAVGVNTGLPSNGGCNSWLTMAATLHRQGQLAQQGMSVQREGHPLESAPHAVLRQGVQASPTAIPHAAVAQRPGSTQNPYAGFPPLPATAGQPHMQYNPYAGIPPPFLPPPRALASVVAAALTGGGPDEKSNTGSMHPRFGHPTFDQQMMHVQHIQQVSPVAGAGSQGKVPVSKKPRVAWTPELHTRFVKAVTELGIYTAVPKQIMLVRTPSPLIYPLPGVVK